VQSKAWVCGSSRVGIVGSNPTGSSKFRSYDCCLLSGRDFCVGLIIHPEDPYRVWRVPSVWSRNHDRKSGRSATGGRIFLNIHIHIFAISERSLVDCDSL